MIKADWDSLCASPGWPALKGYLMDYRAKIMELWASGELKGPKADEAAVRCEIMHDLATLEWSDIEKFYSPPEQGNEADEQQS